MSFSITEPIWFIGPSRRIEEYIDFLTQKVPRENVFTISHVFTYLILKYNYVPKFFSWQDPHQTYSLHHEFNNIKDKVNQETYYLTFPFTRDTNVFFKHYASSSYGKNFKEYHLTLKQLSNHKFLIEEPCHLRSLLNYGKETAKRLFEDPEFRFNQNEAVLGTQYCQLENWITRFVYPICQHLNIKTAYLLGFDGEKNRFYEKGSNNKINVIHKQFRNLNKWQEWKPYHNIDMQNIQKDSPLSKFMKTVTPEESLISLK